jgi:hypothetical protein
MFFIALLAQQGKPAEPFFETKLAWSDTGWPW